MLTRAAMIGVGGFTLLAGSLGCSSSSDSSSKRTEPEQACHDAADAIGNAASRCGLDYQANYDAFVNAAAVGSCSNIVALRDKASLYATCVPFLRNLTCEQLNDPNLVLDPSCSQQLLRQS